MGLDVTCYVVVGELYILKKFERELVRYNQITGEKYIKKEDDFKYVLNSDEQVELDEDNDDFCLFYDPEEEFREPEWVVQGLKVSTVDLRGLEHLNTLKYDDIENIAFDYVHKTGRKAEIFHVMSYGC